MSVEGVDGIESLNDSGFDIRQTTIGGRRVVAKTGTGRSRGRLRREAAALQQVRSGSVVELIELRETESSTTLVTAYLGARTLADTSMLLPNEILRAVHGACRAVRDLHHRGWSHGNLAAEHVILGPRTRVRLCSFGDAGPTTDSDVSQDVDQLITLVNQLIDSAISGQSIRERREWRQVRSQMTRAVENAAASVARDGLDENAADAVDSADTADSACAASTGRTDDRLNRLLTQLNPDGPVPARGRLRDALRITSFPARLRVPVIAIAIVALCAAVISGVLPWLRQGGPEESAGATTTGAAPTSISSSGSGTRQSGTSKSDARLSGTSESGTSESSTSESSTRGASTTAPLTSDRAPRPAGDPGNLVVSHGKIYRIGSAGDRVAVGDWHCDGTERALVLRPSTGEVFMFDDWADGKAPSTARRIGTVDGAIEFVDRGRAGDCGPAVVRTGSGSDREITLPRP